MDNTSKTIKIIRTIKDEDKAVKRAMEVAKDFRILTYQEAYAVLEKKLGELSVNCR